MTKDAVDVHTYCLWCFLRAWRGVLATSYLANQSLFRFGERSVLCRGRVVDDMLGVLYATRYGYVDPFPGKSALLWRRSRRSRGARTRRDGGMVQVEWRIGRFRRCLDLVVPTNNSSCAGFEEGSTSVNEGPVVLVVAVARYWQYPHSRHTPDLCTDLQGFGAAFMDCRRV